MESTYGKHLWKALIGIQTNEKNLPFDIENTVCYAQSLLLNSLLVL